MGRSWSVYIATLVGTLALVWVAATQWKSAGEGTTLEELGLGKEPGPWAMVLLFVAGGLVLGGAHCVAMFAASPSWRRRVLYVRLLPWSASGAAVFLGAIVVGTAVATIVLGAFVDFEESVALGYLVGSGVALVAVACFVMVLRQREVKPWRALGFSRYRFWRHVAMGAIACLVFRFVAGPVLHQVVAALLHWLGQTVEGHEALEHYVKAASVWDRVVIIGAITVAAPVLEEIIFRGVLFQTIKRYAGSTVAIVTSAVLFAALHGTLYVGLNIFFLGLLLGYLFDKTGSIVPCIALHFFFNLVPAVVLVLGP